MAITVGSTFELVNLYGTYAEVGSYLIQNAVGQASVLTIQSPVAGSMAAYFYK